MKNTKLIFTIILSLVLASSAFSQNKLYGTVTQVLDGKTLVVEPQEGIKITLELQYIEIPESEQPLYSTVKDHLKKLVLNQTVMFEPMGMASEKTMGKVFLNGVDISQQMIRDGAAWHSISEKRNQDASESQMYESNQAQAKAEKRGVWSVEGLKPAWEFRAERAEKKRREKVEKIRAMQAAARVKLAAKPKPKKRAPRPAAGTSKFGIEMWGDSPNAGLKKLGGYDNLFQGFNPQSNVGFIITDQSTRAAKAGKISHKFGVRVFYAARGDVYAATEGYYFLAFVSSSKNWKFVRNNKLVVYKDGTKMHFGRPLRMFRKEPGGVGELLMFLATKQQLNMLSKAKRLRFSVGSYSGSLTKKDREMMTELLDASK